MKIKFKIQDFPTIHIYIYIKKRKEKGMTFYLTHQIIFVLPNSDYFPIGKLDSRRTRCK